MNTEFWKTNILDWEKNRYDSVLSKIIYSSLHSRQQHLKKIIEQLPSGTKVLELGCGSGRLYQSLSNKNELQYIGVDFSETAIQKAQEQSLQQKNVAWVCASVEDLKNIHADYAVSIGLMDWISTEQFQKLISQNNLKYHVHSFSLNSHSLKARLHRFFTSLIRLNKNSFYSPQYFTIDEIKMRMHAIADLKIYQSPSLSFGAFIHNLPEENTPPKIDRYFSNSSQKNIFKKIFKAKELVEFQRLNIEFTKKNILEIGSGFGHYSNYILNKNPEYFLALDPHTDTQKNIQRSTLHFHLEKFENTQFEFKFDRILCIGVLEFVKDVEFFLEKIFKSANSNCEIVLVYPQTKSFFYPFYRAFHFVKNNFILTELQTSALIQKIQKHSPLCNIKIQKYGYLNTCLHITKQDL